MGVENRVGKRGVKRIGRGKGVRMAVVGRIGVGRGEEGGAPAAAVHRRRRRPVCIRDRVNTISILQKFMTPEMNNNRCTYYSAICFQSGNSL